MKRQRTNVPKKIAVMQQTNQVAVPISTFSELITRANLASQLGADTYSGNRDVYNALGYPKTVKFSDFYTRYVRQDMAKAVIDRPVKASWKGELKIIENAEKGDTPFEKAWSDMYKNLRLKNLFMRVDRITGLGRYSVILLGLSDVRKGTDFALPVRAKKSLTLVYAKPFSEHSATIESFETDQTNPRYGLPKYYNINITDVNSTASGEVTAGMDKAIKVHHSRIIHITEDNMESEVYGTPRLEAIYNRLIDLEKLVGGDAEMFWRGARPGYTGKVDSDYQLTDTEKENLLDQINEFEHNLKRVLVNEGIEYKALAQQIADPSAHVDVMVQMISAVSGIPKRILVGSERGELSSAQDKAEWMSYVSGRREEHNEPSILRPFIDALIDLKVIPTPKDGIYSVVWDKLFALTDKEKVDAGKLRAISIREYATNPAAQYFIPYASFLRYVMGFDDVQIAAIKQDKEDSGYGELTLEEIAELAKSNKEGNTKSATSSQRQVGEENAKKGEKSRSEPKN